MNHIPEALIIGGGVVAQAAASLPLESVGGLVSALGPTALLGIGIVWAIRRGDKLVEEIHEIRASNDAMMKEAISTLAVTAEAMREHNHVIQYCKDKVGIKKP